MVATLRLTLTIFWVGFLVEGVGDLYAYVTRAAQLPGGDLLVYFAPAFTVVGLASLWIGRHEWNELHQARVRHAHLAFGVVLLFAVVAAAPLALSDVLQAAPSPLSSWVFGIAVAGLLWFLYLTYALAAGHLTGTFGRLLVALALGWAAVIAALVGSVAQSSFPVFLSALETHTLSVHALTDPFMVRFSGLFGTYLLLFGAFIDAHRRVVRGDAAGGATAPQPPSVTSGSPGAR